jgi:hypothetical protein
MMAGPCLTLLLLLLCFTPHEALALKVMVSLQHHGVRVQKSLSSPLYMQNFNDNNDDEDPHDNDVQASTSRFPKINPLYTGLATAETVFWYWLAPGIDPDSRWFAPADGALISKLLDPSIVLSEPGYALSSLLLNSFLIVPAVWALLLLQEEEEQFVSPVPFCLAGFVVGGGSLMPYMIVRKPQDTVDPERFPPLLQLFEQSNLIFATLLALLTSTLFDALVIEFSHSTWTVEWTAFLDRLQTSQFTSLALFDFVLLSCTIIDPMKDDAKRRGYLDDNAPALPKLAPFLIPIVGHVAWIVLRPKYFFSNGKDGNRHLKR